MAAANLYEPPAPPSCQAAQATNNHVLNVAIVCSSD